MITPFFGELGLVEIPLEVSHNFCSHKCLYCFANLNKPDRKADTKKIFNQLSKAHTQNTITARFINERFPISVSNKTDPFALSNYKISIPMLKMMADMGIPVQMLSRGGKNLDEFLNYHNTHILWYISITHTSEEVAKLVEPGAPSLAARWALCDELKQRGHYPVVAINPYHSKWVDNEKMLQLLEQHQPYGVIIQNLHINAEQMANMSEREIERGGEALQDAKRKKKYGDPESIASRSLYEGVRSLNMPALLYSYPTQTFGLEDVYKKVYPGKTLNTHFGFSEWCFANKQEGDYIHFDEYLQYMIENIPFAYEKFAIGSYVTSICRLFRTGGLTLPARISFAQIFNLFWNEYRINRQLNKFVNFQQLLKFTDDSEKEAVAELDDKGNRIFVFTKHTDRDSDFFVHNKKQVA